MPFTRLLETIGQHPQFKEQITLLCHSGQAAFAGLPGAASSLLLTACHAHFPIILIVVATTAKAEAVKEELELFSRAKVALFPAPDMLPGEGLLVSREIIGERLGLLWQLKKKSPLLIVAPIKALMWQTSQTIEALSLVSKQRLPLDKLIMRLVDLGYQRFDIVGEPGEFSVRGGLVDIFPVNLKQPIRLELADDLLVSLRSFATYNQRSLGSLAEAVVVSASEEFAKPVFAHFSKQTLVAFDNIVELEQLVKRELARAKTFPSPLAYLDLLEIKKLAAPFKQLELSAFLGPDTPVLFSQPLDYRQQLTDISDQTIVVSRHAARLREEISAVVIEGNLRGGCQIADLELLSDRELFGEIGRPRRARPMVKEGVAEELLARLKIGDYVVHENYGVALYQGLELLTIEGIEREYLVLEFAQKAKVYVPPSMVGMVEKFSAAGGASPRLSKLGSGQWEKTKSRVKKALTDMTSELLHLYAHRQKLPGFSFLGDDLWQKDLADTFPFEETPDQQRAILATKEDMAASRPMDRLVCGDVGYGKTEVAVRAAAKAAAAGKQVVILVPTTILAEQHYNNFKERFKETPFVIAMLSRFRLKKDQAQTVADLARAKIDIVIGTHRLLSKDVRFHDLGLLVIDEEQRFGVRDKERLKKIKQNVDVLTLSATPIPRTLYLSLAGARDLSVINTAPIDRSPIRTYVLPYNEAVVREAILREIDRGGQIYFLHNVVKTIVGAAAKIKRLVPEAKVAVAHGQMPERQLENTMIDFLDRKFDVLVCTSIIESGLDIQNVNTILINNADHFGLSQLYQIRGRVGRSAVKAYAYLFYQPHQVMTTEAQQRLAAITEFTALGSGYKLAMRDLEIRGAGNLLGREQSGHILEVGFDLYCELLEQAVREVKGQKSVSPREVMLDLKVEGFIPEAYIVDERQRIAVYRRMNLLQSQAELLEMKQELLERFGPVPAKLAKLFELLSLKVKALQAGVKSIKEENDQLIVAFFDGRLRRLEIKGCDKLKLAEQGIAGQSLGRG